MSSCLHPARIRCQDVALRRSSPHLQKSPSPMLLHAPNPAALLSALFSLAHVARDAYACLRPLRAVPHRLALA